MKVFPSFVYKLFVSFAMFGVFFSTDYAFAGITYGSQTYHIIGYGASNEWNAVGGDQLVAANDNDADWSYITVNTTGKAETYTFGTPTLPSGAVLNGVSLYMFAKKMDVSDDGITDPANDPQIAFRVEDGAHPTNVSDDSPVTVSNDGTYHLYSRHMVTNPITHNDWTLSDLTSGALRYGIVRTNEGSETGIEPRVTAVWIDINYAINDATTTATSTESGTGGSGGSGGGSGSGSSTSTNTTPTANAQTITTPVNVTATTTLTGTDSDIPAQTLTYTIATTTTNGTTTLVGNVVTYVPNVGFVGTDTFTFVVSDGIATSTPATVTITVGTPSSGGGSGSGSGSGGGSGSSSSAGSGGSGGGSSSSGGGSSSSSGGGYFVNANGQPVSGGGSGSPQGQVLGASSTCGIYMTKYTRNGYKNDVETVKKLQMFLNSYLKVSIPVTGYFGPITERYVKVLQSRHQDVMLMPWKITTPSGLSYITTVVGINNIVCPSLKLPIPANLIEWSKNSSTPEKLY